MVFFGAFGAGRRFAGEICFPVHIRETHSRGLSGKLTAQFSGVSSRQFRDGLENDAMLGVAPPVRLQPENCLFARFAVRFLTWVTEHAKDLALKFDDGGRFVCGRHWASVEQSNFPKLQAHCSWMRITGGEEMVAKRGKKNRKKGAPGGAPNLGIYAAVETMGRTKSIRSMAAATP